jgi:hypothetical protein
MASAQAELPETFPWRQIEASQFVWPLFARPGLLAGGKDISTYVLTPSSSTHTYTRINAITFTQDSAAAELCYIQTLCFLQFYHLSLVGLSAFLANSTTL